MNAPRLRANWPARSHHPALFGWVGAMTGKTTRLLREVWGPEAYAHVHESTGWSEVPHTHLDLWDGRHCLATFDVAGRGLGAVRKVNQRAREWIGYDVEERKAAQGMGLKTVDQVRSDNVNKRGR